MEKRILSLQAIVLFVYYMIAPNFLIFMFPQEICNKISSFCNLIQNYQFVIMINLRATNFNIAYCMLYIAW